MKDGPMTKPTKREELEPCPHCGDLAWMHSGSVFDHGVTGWRVECEGACHAMTCWWHTKDEARAAWNRRPLAAPAQSAEPQEAEALAIVQAIRATGWTTNNPNAKEPLWDYYKTEEEATQIVKAAIRARLASKPSREEAQKLIEHCASLAVSYMQDQPSWNGTVADCGYLRNAIVNGDHADFLTARPSREEEMREAKTVREECAQILRDDAETLARNGMTQKAHGLIRGAHLILEQNTRERAALAQGGARDEGEGK